MKSLRYLIWIPIILIALVLMGLTGYELVMSFTEYNALSGFESGYVGLDQYAKLFDYALFGTAMVNTIVQGLLSVLPAMVLGVVAATILDLIPHKVVKAALAGGALMLALVPNIVWEQMMQSLLLSVASALRMNSVNPNILIMLTSLFPSVGMIVFAGLSLSISNDISAWKGALASSLIPCLLSFFPDLRDVFLFADVSPRSRTLNTSYLHFYLSFITMDMSPASALSVICRLLSLFLGIVPALVIGWVGGRSGKYPRYREAGHRWFFAMLAAGIMAVLTMAVILLCNFSLEMTFPQIIGRSALNAILVALIVLFLSLPCCLAVIAFSQYNRSMISFGMLSMCLIYLSTNLLTGYLLLTNRGMIDTLFGIAFASLCNPVFLTVVILLTAQRPATWRQTIFLALGGAFVAAACSAGDFLPAALVSYSSEIQPLAALLYSQVHTGKAALADSSRFLLTLMTLVIALPGVVLIIGGVCGSYAVHNKE